ncbi:MAG: transposase [Pirellulaceae bacterium]
MASGGSWSDFVGAWELFRFGRTTKSVERHVLTESKRKLRERTRESLKYSAVTFSGIQARAIGRGFAEAVRKSNYTIWACSILPEHVHLVMARHTYRVELMVDLLKGEATKQLNKERLHPLAEHAPPGERPPKPWARGQWQVYLSNEEQIEEAIHYVEENPVKEEKPAQCWSCVTKFAGLEPGWITYH